MISLLITIHTPEPTIPHFRLLPLRLLLLLLKLLIGYIIFVDQAVQVFSGHVSRLAEPGHSALAGELVRAVL